MRLWTFQSLEVYQILTKDKQYTCDFFKSELYREFKQFAKAYRWMKEQMKDRNMNPDNVCPVWCWYKWNGRHQRPDLRYSDFKYRNTDEYLLTLEVPDELVLLSDFDEWHMILNDYYDDAEHIFNVDKSDYIQACIPKIKADWIVDAKLCLARPEN